MKKTDERRWKQKLKKLEKKDVRRAEIEGDREKCEKNHRKRKLEDRASRRKTL